jgi:hypothetical protein
VSISQPHLAQAAQLRFTFFNARHRPISSLPDTDLEVSCSLGVGDTVSNAVKGMRFEDAPGN